MSAAIRPANQPMPEIGQLVFNIEETAEVLRVSEKTVRRQIKDGSLPFSQIGRRIVIQRRDILGLLDSSRIEGPQTKPLPPSRKSVNKKIRVHKRS